MIFGIVKTKGTKFFNVGSLYRKDGYWGYGFGLNLIPRILGFYAWIERW